MLIRKKHDNFKKNYVDKNKFVNSIPFAAFPCCDCIAWMRAGPPNRKLIL